MGTCSSKHNHSNSHWKKTSLTITEANDCEEKHHLQAPHQEHEYEEDTNIRVQDDDSSDENENDNSSASSNSSANTLDTHLWKAPHRKKSSVSRRKNSRKISIADLYDLSVSEFRSRYENLGCDKVNVEQQSSTSTPESFDNHDDHDVDLTASSKVLSILQERYGVQLEEFCVDPKAPLSSCRKLLSKTDSVIVMEGWNKALAFRTRFIEALIMRWRYLAAIREVQDGPSLTPLFSQVMDDIAISSSSRPNRVFFESRQSRSIFESRQSRSKSIILKRSAVKNNESTQRTAKASILLEENEDPISMLLGPRMNEFNVLILCALDMAVRKLCPHSQVVNREAYRPLEGSTDPDPRISSIFFNADDCKSLEELFIVISRCGLKASYWLDFCEAFVWAIKTHSPYIKEQDVEDLEKPSTESAYAKFVSGMIVVPIVEVGLKLKCMFSGRKYQKLRELWKKLLPNAKERAELGLSVSKRLFEEYNHLGDQIPVKYRDHLGAEFIEIMDSMIENAAAVIMGKDENLNDFHMELREKGEKYKTMNLLGHTFECIGVVVLDVIQKLFLDSKEKSAGSTIIGVSVIDLEEALSSLYQEALVFIAYPAVMKERLKDEAAVFLKSVADELSWSAEAFSSRLVSVNAEIDRTGTYTHTSEEIEIGARLSWRNSAKCIGRISWNTLVVRDMRHIKSPYKIFEEVEHHLKLATAGTNIQSVMTVFEPRKINEAWGTRFWSSQFVRYAGYKDRSSGNILGDPANVSFTDFVIKHGLWSPPSKRSGFDILPIVLKHPKFAKPIAYQIRKELIHEIEIEHPSYPEIAELGLKWAAVPAISNFSMKLGGIEYPCCPFNGWFASIEIVRNLMERYHVSQQWAIKRGLSLEDRILDQKVATELEDAILHSFDTQAFTIVDSATVGKQFLAHCKRERGVGRECPAQWSWIGGLVGPSNPTWHNEMRDFYVTPQFDYCADPWQVMEIPAKYDFSSTPESFISNYIDGRELEGVAIPKVCIAHGSETGAAEATAFTLARKLAILNPVVMPLGDLTGLSLIEKEEITHFLIICSTFGKGEPPTNAREFFEVGVKGSSLENVSIAVLALGSKLYPDFCKAGRDLNRMLLHDGRAKQLVDLECVDETSGAQEIITTWLESIEKLLLSQNVARALKN